MLSVNEARARLLSDVRALSAERVPLAESVGRTLGESVFAADDLPAFDYSAMDGYAVALGDFTQDGGGEPPWTFRVENVAAAGAAPPPHQRGTACRIFTGAPLPAGADAVVMQENVTVEGGWARFRSTPTPGQNIRRAGEDLARGALALGVGVRMTPAGLALAAMLDRPELVVTRRPRVTILCTGDELRAPGDGRRPGSIPESNSAAISALAKQAGATTRIAPIARDEPGAVRRAIEAALEGTDVLVTIGGVSVGDHDYVRSAFDQVGVTLEFWKVAMKPGKPLAIGKTQTARVLGLPGNPASALVTFAVFGMPLLRTLQGDVRPLPTPLPARTTAARRPLVERTEFVRASLDVAGGTLLASAYDNQASGAATSLANSDGFFVFPPGTTAIEPGAVVDFVRWIDL